MVNIKKFGDDFADGFIEVEKLAKKKEPKKKAKKRNKQTARVLKLPEAK